MNVQIKGLIYDKPHWGGASRRPGCDFILEIRKETVKHLFELLRRRINKTSRKSKSERGSRKKHRCTRKKGRTRKEAQKREQNVRRNTRRGEGLWTGQNTTAMKWQIRKFYFDWFAKIYIVFTNILKAVIVWINLGYRQTKLRKFYSAIHKVRRFINVTGNQKACVTLVEDNLSKLKKWCKKKHSESAALNICKMNIPMNIKTEENKPKNEVQNEEFKENQNKLSIINTVSKTMYQFICPIIKILNVNKERKISTVLNFFIMQVNEAVKNCFFVSTVIMILLTIVLSLICQGVEQNPGPPKKTEIITY